MNITTTNKNGCPTMEVTKGNITFIYEGMNLILTKAILKLENATVDGKDYIEITDEKTIGELEEKLITEEESKEIYEMIK